MKNLRWMTGFLTFLGVACTFAVQASADSWPERSVRIISAYPPGGASDNITRIVAARLTTELGQTFVVVNRPGAGGMIGTSHAAKAKNDGYTLLLSPSGPLATALPFFDDIGFDPVKDFSAISYVGHYEMAMLTNNSTPYKTATELLSYAKKNPGQVRFAVPTVGGIPHLVGELFQWQAGIRTIKVPYKGSAESVADLIAGHTDISVESLPAVMQLINAGKLRPLAVTSDKRLPLFPDVPTYAELGFPDIVAYAWLALLAPAGTPKPIVDKLSQTMKKILSEPAIIEQFGKTGAHAKWMDADKTDDFIRSEIVRWRKVVDEAGVRESFRVK